MREKKVEQKQKGQSKGITLVALVVTIVVLLILAGVTITMLVGDNGIIARAREAKNAVEKAQGNEQNELGDLANQLANVLGENTTVEPPEPPEPPGPPTLTEENVHEYLGKIVINYTGQTKVTIGSETYTVSPTYRLYYVDFANKYGDGEGTIYLKAESVYGNYELPITDTSLYTDENIKIRALNPSLYANGATPPSASNNNMKAVTWLTNTTNWASLADTTMSSNINYIVGSPSLEMMMDSYNTYYQLTGNTPDYSPIPVGTRRKLFYQYPTEVGNKTGYAVGPCAGDNAAYGTVTSDNSVYTDSKIDTMYFPGTNLINYLASPSAYGSDYLMGVSSSNIGWVKYGRILEPRLLLKSMSSGLSKA